MKAFQLQQYDKKNLALNCVDLPRPQVAPNEVLIEVKAAGVNPLDNMITRGDVKMITPYALPQTMGNECAGLIVEVGSEVSDFAVGDAVFSRLPISRPGAFAEYVAVPADAVARMPEGLSFEEAASIPLTALTAYQALDLLEAKPGSSIFISGGSGGLGAMAIPLAKARGLKVYTNGNSASRERVMALGADRYLDYREEDYLEVLEPVDYVLDSLGGKELERQMQLLRRGGKIVSLRGMPNARFAKRFGLPTWKRWLLALAAFGEKGKTAGCQLRILVRAKQWPSVGRSRSSDWRKRYPTFSGAGVPLRRNERCTAKSGLRRSIRQGGAELYLTKKTIL